jgi:acylphosphatase
MPFDPPETSGRSNRRQLDENESGQLNRSRRSPRQSAANFERWGMVVRGQVQGVGYRAACERRATELGLSGWVCNCSDGSVEVQAEGDPQQLIELRVWCESGPQGARVASVQASRVPCTGADWFEIRPDRRSGITGINPAENEAP